jgi:peptide/nickel transport system permease protein
MRERDQAGGYSSGRRSDSRPLLILSATILLLLLASAIAAPLVATHDPLEQDYEARLLSPGEDGHLLGTDDLGRDVFSRIVFGGRSALTVGLISVSIALGIGLLVGLTAGLSGRTVEKALMLLMDGVLAFPTILLAIAVVTVFGYGISQVMVAVGIVFSPVFARLIRAETLLIKTEGYIEAARSLGTSPFVMTFRHIIPNMSGKLVVQCSATFALSVVVEASLSFLGLGTQPPNPSWGLMLKDARNYLFSATWLAVYPGLALALTVLCFNLLGDALSDRLNPLNRRQ